jgi:hypothetical protein
MDSGYFGNRPSTANPHGWKLWHRVVANDLQHGAVQPRPPDRWQRHQIAMPKRTHGTHIVIAAPDAKPCIFYGINLEQWLEQTMATLRQHTDRPILVRQRNPNRQTRLANDFTASLQDVHAVVTFNSIAATESILAGVPVFVLAPTNAALPMANRDLANIEQPWFPHTDQIHAWACYLAYGQFHNNELQDGTALKILKEWDYA